MAPVAAPDREPEIDEIVESYAAALTEKLRATAERMFPPSAEKVLRKFTAGEAAKMIGISDSYLRTLALAGSDAAEKTTAGRRLYSLAEINDIRAQLDAKTGGYLMRRPKDRGPAIVSAVNFKGGSSKTTQAAHLAEYLALRSYRVLVIDLDPQASLSSLLGIQPELQVKANETIYGALRFDENRRPVREVVRKTYFTGLDIIPANIELQEFEYDTARHASGKSDELGPWFMRLAAAISELEDEYDVVILDCPPQLGYLTISAMCASTGLLVTIHPQMLDASSCGQFLYMAADLLRVVREHVEKTKIPFKIGFWLSFLLTRFEPNDGPQRQIEATLRTLFGEAVLKAAALKSTAISDAGLSKQTIYEVHAKDFTKETYHRALESMNAVGAEVESIIRTIDWGQSA